MKSTFGWAWIRLRLDLLSAARRRRCLWKAEGGGRVGCGAPRLVHHHAHPPQQGQEERSVKAANLVASLKACRGRGSDDLERGRLIHAQLLLLQSGSGEANTSVANALMHMYAKCGSMGDALQLFHTCPHPNAISWNIVIAGCARQPQQREVALRLYAQMLQQGFSADARTFVATLIAASGCRCLEKGRAIHSQIVKRGLLTNVYVSSTLLDMYVKCGSIADAMAAFHTLPPPHRSAVTWNIVILAHVDKQHHHTALRLFHQMQQEGVVPDEPTCVAALNATRGVHANSLRHVRSIHSQLLHAGIHLRLATMLLDMYAKGGSMPDALHLFHSLPHRDVTSWNAIISGYTHNHDAHLALQCYADMLQQGVLPDNRTFVAALKACTRLATLEQEEGGKLKRGCLEKGMAIHHQLLLLNTDSASSDAFLTNTLMHMYAKCGSMPHALHLFRNMPHPDVVSWNVLITAHVDLNQNQPQHQHQHRQQGAFQLYAQMLRKADGPAPNANTYVTILRACANAAALEAGKYIHAHLVEAGVDVANHLLLASALIDMYGKCGSMFHAQQLFDALPHPPTDVVLWNALIAGYARQADAAAVFGLLDTMEQHDIKPDSLTFLPLLNACAHAGLLDKGHHYFNAMTRQYGLAPSIQHYSCMVDLLGRAGHVHEAFQMLHTMPFPPDIIMWTTVLAACQKWGHLELAKRAFHSAITLDDKQAATYALMSNVYAQANMWQQRDEVQAMRRNAQAWKEPGKSWWTEDAAEVEMEAEAAEVVVHSFVAGDQKHPQSKQICERVQQLCATMQGARHPLPQPTTSN